MGQAKARGTFEERQAAAIEKRRCEEAARVLAEMQARRADQEWLRSLAPEVRQRVLDRRRVQSLRLASLAGVIAASRAV